MQNVVCVKCLPVTSYGINHEQKEIHEKILRKKLTIRWPDEISQRLQHRTKTTRARETIPVG